MSILKKSKIVFWASLSFVIGVGVASFSFFSLWPFRFYLFGLVIIFAICLIGEKHRKTALIGLFLFLGIWRLAIMQAPITADSIGYYSGHVADVIGWVSAEPEGSNGGQKLVVTADSIKRLDSEKFIKTVSGDISVWSYGNYAYGDEVRLHCVLENSPERLGESYANFMASKGLDIMCRKAEVKLIEANKHKRFYDFVFVARDKVQLVINQFLNGSDAALAVGVVLGGSSQMDNETKTNFSRAGLTHLIAVSGLNITIMATLVMSVLFFIGIGRRPAFYIATAWLLFYIFLVGAPASARRAGLMGFLVLWALYLGRINRAGNSLWLAAAAMLAFNPLLLRGDLGFILSFLSMAAIIYIHPMLSRGLEKIKIPEMRGWRDALSITLSTQIMTMPVVAYNFAQVSIASIAANLLVEWTSTWLLISVLVGVLLGTIAGPIGWIAFLPALILCKYVVAVAVWLGNIKYGVWQSGSWSIFVVVGYYLVLIYWINRKSVEGITPLLKKPACPVGREMD